MRYVCFTLLIVSLAVPAAFAMEATISNDASGSTGNSISTAPLHDGNTKATQFDQGWDAAVTNIGICEYQNGVDGLLVDDFEITTPGDVGASTTFHVPYNGDGTPPEYTSPTRVDVFMDTDSGSGPSSAYGFPWTADTMTFNAGPSDWTETLWDTGSEGYTFDIDFNYVYVMPATPYWFGHMHYHDRWNGGQMGTYYEDQGSTYGDECYFDSDYFGYPWLTWSRALGIKPP